jgi:hypothetical protein
MRSRYEHLIVPRYSAVTWPIHFRANVAGAWADHLRVFYDEALQVYVFTSKVRYLPELVFISADGRLGWRPQFYAHVIT